MSRPVFLRMSLLCLPLALAACSVKLGQGQEDEAELCIDRVSAAIGPEGGVLEATCGRLVVPAGALETPATVTLHSMRSRLDGPLELQGPACEVDFGGALLKSPASLFVRFDASRFVDGVPPTLIAVKQEPGEKAWSTAWMPALAEGGFLPVSLYGDGTYAAALALADEKACDAGISYCAMTRGSTPSSTSAPSTWTKIPGTSGGQYELDSLYKYYKNPGYVSEGLCALSLACSWDGLTAQTQLKIQTQCSKLPCPYNLVCAAQIVNEALSQDSDNVCRHYAWAMREAAALLGYSANFECGWDGTTGHAWVQVDCGGNTYLLDAFAQTYVSTTGAVPAACGNKIVETGEQCDGSSAGCSTNSDCVSCQCVARCGNGKLDQGEQCDGTQACPSGQACQSCQCVTLPPPPVCGNQLLEPGEQCETWAACPSGKTCDAQCQCVTTTPPPPPPPPACGNGKLDSGEQCDGAAQGCSSGQECVNCQCLPLCGNAKLDAGEQCDGVGVAQCNAAAGQTCYKCQCTLFAQCAGLPSQSMCLACCEGAALNAQEFQTCASTHCK